MKEQMQLNGQKIVSETTELKQNDLITLLAVKNRFIYHLCAGLAPQAASASQESTYSVTTNCPPISASIQPSSNEILKKVLRAYECSICCDTMAYSINLSPCGDTFCASCILDWKNSNFSKSNLLCPMCQTGPCSLPQSMPNRLNDSVVRGIFEGGAIPPPDPQNTVLHLLPPSEKEVWEQRVAQGLADWNAFVASSSRPTLSPPPPVSNLINLTSSSITGTIRNSSNKIKERKLNIVSSGFHLPSASGDVVDLTDNISVEPPKKNESPANFLPVT
jgi:hypothetical protein